MMTELLFQTDSYRKSCNAVVTAVDEKSHGIVLGKTVFFPGGGGQPPDRGMITFGDRVYEVSRAKKIDGQLVHLLAGESKLPTIGTEISAQMDWALRYKLMRTHTAMHILCGVIFRDYGATVTGGNMEPLKGRMDFEFETMRKELVREIESAINVEVVNNRSVSWRTLPREEAFQIPDLIRTKINLLPKFIQEVRVVEIEGLDLQADGGTHVKSTGEVGVIRVTDYKSKGKINKRIYVELQDEQSEAE
jgi:misacylated tRNA(Ala) deacylase